MTARGATAATLAEINAARSSPIHLVNLYLDSGTLYVTDSFRSVVWNGNTYSALGHLIDFDSIDETTDLQVNEAQCTLTGADAAGPQWISMFLTENYLDRRVLIYKGFLNDSDRVIIDPIAIFDGRLDVPTISENPDEGSSVVSFRAGSHFTDFERRNGRRTNHNDAQMYFPGDNGFKYAGMSGRDIRWGGPPTGGSSEPGLFPEDPTWGFPVEVGGA